jgi:2'-5' RNA ligase
VSRARWYWGIVVRADASRTVLEGLAATIGDEDGPVRVQHPQTGHLTLFYAPLRGRDAAPALADRIREAAAEATPFDLELGGFGEFPSATRPVAWLDVATGADRLHDLRERLCACDADDHRHPFVPHLTLAYGDDPETYARARPALLAAARDARLAVRVDALWVAGFPQSAHPARDLRYVERVPLGA